MQPNPLWPDRPWTTIPTVGLRFLIIFSPLALIPLPAAFDGLIVAFGRVVLGIDGEISTNFHGSGDTTYHWVHLILSLSCSGLITLVWSAAHRTPKNHDQLLYILTVFLRYILMTTFAVYGLSKVFLTQFSFPSLVRLVQPIGETYPMGLMWTFMGYSAGYSIFTGLLEVVGGLLLLSRRTLTLGAALLAGIMANVVMLNICYDVPVKLYSMTLLLFTGFLLALDGRRIWDVFVRGEGTRNVNFGPVFAARTMKRLRLAAKLGAPTLVLGGITIGFLMFRDLHPVHAPKPPLYGLYEVDTFIHRNTTVPPLLTATHRWRYIVMDRGARLTVIFMNGRKQTYDASVDSDHQTLSAKPISEGDELHFRYEVGEGHLRLFGKLAGDPLETTSRRVDVQQLPLLRQHFRWVIDKPDNR